MAIVSLQQVAVILASNVGLTSSGCWATAGVFFSWWSGYSLPRVFLLAGFYYLLRVAGVLQCYLAYIVVLQQVDFISFIHVLYIYIILYIYCKAVSSDYFYYGLIANYYLD